jgi:hypothetical protein
LTVSLTQIDQTDQALRCAGLQIRITKQTAQIALPGGHCGNDNVVSRCDLSGIETALHIFGPVPGQQAFQTRMICR